MAASLWYAYASYGSDFLSRPSQSVLMVLWYAWLLRVCVRPQVARNSELYGSEL